MSKNTGKKKINKQITTALSVIAWSIIGLVIIWYLIVLFSIVYYLLFFKSLYIPEIVKMTNYSIALVLAWTLIVYILSMAWFKYNSYLLVLKEKKATKTNQLVYIQKDIPWSEALISKIDSQNILEELIRVKNNLEIVRLNQPVTISHANKKKPQELFNIAITAMNEGRFLYGISILRIIIGHPESSFIVKQVAIVKLSQCLFELGYEVFENIQAKKVI